ncbi:hypothetical protein ABPG74_008755 [Tetrahymena malaccensis]
MSDQPEQATQQANLQQQQQPPVQTQVLQYPFQYVQQPLVQSQVVAQPIYTNAQVPTTQFLGSTLIQGATQQVSAGTVLHQSGVQVSGVPVQTTLQREVVKGESRIEYIPYEKTVIEYEAVQRIEYVPKEKKVTDYYAVEYQTEYIPQVYQDRYIEYVPTERVQERVEYQAIEKQVVHQPAQEVSQVYVSQVPVQSVAQVPVAQQLTSSQVHVLPPTQTVVTGGQQVAYQNQSFAYAPVQQSVVYTTPAQLGQSVYRGPTILTNSVAQKPVQQNAKKEEKTFLERIFE